jgi:hypothetical protein
MKLPDSVGSWQLADSPQRIEPAGIFDYMNGAGELYLGYRFRYLDAYEYTGKDDRRILVEVYQMKSSDDAFGLLSLDWGGEPLELGATNGSGEFPTALYGAGLLRIWSGDVYARILAETDNAATRAAVVQLGQAVAGGRTNPSPPDLLRLLPAEVSGYRLVTGRISYFRSYLVLNSIYFLSTENILQLGLEDEAVTALFQSGSGDSRKTTRLVNLRYRSDAGAQAALTSFTDAYFKEKSGDRIGAGLSTAAVLVEDGWMGFQREGRHLILVFESPDEDTVRAFFQTPGFWQRAAADGSGDGRPAKE